MTRKTKPTIAHGELRNIRVVHRADDLFNLRADASLELVGTRDQLLHWLLSRCDLTRAEIWRLGDDKPTVYSTTPVGEIWTPALVITQRTESIWTVTMFERKYCDCETPFLLTLLARLVETNHASNS